MKKVKKTWRGAISVFLCIILLSNAAMIGVLVDGARYRMARAEAELALDSAATSVLSYYNAMLYDLYGLFATDSMDEKQVTDLLTDYTKKSLGIIPVDTSAVQDLNKAVVDAVTGVTGGGEENRTVFNGYEFDIKLTQGTSGRVSLANTDAVEAQIIEHMKYRAPIEMLNSTGGFLEKVKGLFAIVDRMEGALEKAKDDKNSDKEALANDTAALLREISDFNNDVMLFTNVPDLMSFNLPLNAGSLPDKDPWEYVQKFDKDMDDAWAALDEEDRDDESALRPTYENCLDTLLRTYDRIVNNANELHQRANDIRDKVEKLNDRYNTYIAGLQAKVDAEPDNQNIKTLYLPEIELAKSSCGEVLKNMDLVLMGRQYTSNIYDSRGEYRSNFTLLGSMTIDHRFNGGGSPYMETILKGEEISNPAWTGCRKLMTELSQNLHALNVFARDFEEAMTPQIKTEKSSGSEAKEDSEPDTDGLRPFKVDDLKVPREETSSEDWFPNMDSDVDDNIDSILEGGLNLIKKIGEVLENARDSLYINEYAIAYFPNYVQHYNASSKKIATDASNTYLLDSKSDSYYPAFNTTQAELEYIVTGHTNAAACVADISARLLAIRLALNTAAIFTDSAKISQANTLAAAISGPFAPLVATALLIAWALAESVIDVTSLLDGAEDVQLFKQGKGWTLSVEGVLQKAIGKIVDKVGDKVVDGINSKVADGAAAVEQVTNKAIYDAYQAIDSGVNNAVQTAQKSMSDWAKDVDDQMGSNSLGFGNMVDQMSSQAGSQVSSALTDGKDAALQKVNETIRNTSEKIQDKVKAQGSEIKEKITEASAKAINKYIPMGTPDSGENEGEGFNVCLNYMDYMRIFLLFMGNTTKVQRIQSLIQANMRYGKQESFSMAGSYVNISAQLDGSINYLMVGSALMPADLRRDGRLNFTVYTNMSY